MSRGAVGPSPLKRARTVPVQKFEFKYCRGEWFKLDKAVADRLPTAREDRAYTCFVPGCTWMVNTYKGFVVHVFKSHGILCTKDGGSLPPKRFRCTFPGCFYSTNAGKAAGEHACICHTSPAILSRSTTDTPVAAAAAAAAEADASHVSAPEPDHNCTKCSLGTRDDVLLLCDKCDKATHTFCLDPPLERVPDGEFWFCKECEEVMGPIIVDLVKSRAVGVDGGETTDEDEEEGGVWAPRRAASIAAEDASVRVDEKGEGGTGSGEFVIKRIGGTHYKVRKAYLKGLTTSSSKAQRVKRCLVKTCTWTGKSVEGARSHTIIYHGERCTRDGTPLPRLWTQPVARSPPPSASAAAASEPAAQPPRGPPPPGASAAPATAASSAPAHNLLNGASPLRATPPQPVPRPAAPTLTKHLNIRVSTKVHRTTELQNGHEAMIVTQTMRVFGYDLSTMCPTSLASQHMQIKTSPNIKAIPIEDAADHPFVRTYNLIVTDFSGSIHVEAGPDFKSAVYTAGGTTQQQQR